MDYMSNTFPADQDSIRMKDLFRISSTILKRELSQEEKERIKELIPSTSSLPYSSSTSRWNGRESSDLVTDISCE